MDDSDSAAKAVSADKRPSGGQELPPSGAQSSFGWMKGTIDFTGDVIAPEPVWDVRDSIEPR